MRAPDFIVPFTGWRVWQVAVHGGRPVLRSVTYRLVWEHGTVTAGCADPVALEGGRLPVPAPAHDDLAPFPTCRCGIYACKGLARLDRERTLPPFPGAGSQTTLVVGTVDLWGRVIEHERGYRAEHARPSALWVPMTLQVIGADLHPADVADHLAARYGVRARLFRFAHEVAQDAERAAA